MDAKYRTYRKILLWRKQLLVVNVIQGGLINASNVCSQSFFKTKKITGKGNLIITTSEFIKSNNVKCLLSRCDATN